MFNPREWLESQAIRPGIYTVAVAGYEERVGADGVGKLLVRFKLAEEPEKELADFWKEGLAPVMRRAVMLAQLVKPELLVRNYPRPLEFYKAVLDAAKGQWFRVHVVTFQRADGGVGSRINNILGLAEGGPELGRADKDEDLPF